MTTDTEKASSIVGSDPTANTTAALARDLAALERVMLATIQGNQQETEARLNASDKAVEVFSENLTRVPTEVQKAVSALEEVINQKFEGLKERIDGGDARNQERFHAINDTFKNQEAVRIEQKADSQKSLENALKSTNDALREGKATADAALAKTENAFKDQSTQQYATIHATLTALQALVNDVKSRVDRIEAVKIGQGENRVEQRSSTGATLGIVGGITGVLLFVMAVVGFAISLSR